MASILIAGGSLGGLLAANMLLRDGHDVQLLEKARGSLDGRGAGIVTHAALLAGLTRCGIAIDDSLGVQVRSRVLLDAAGQAVDRLDMAQLLTSWSRLYVLLLQAFPAERYHQGAAVQRVEQQADGVRVHTESGGSYEADLLIASDGIRSAVRAQCAPEVVSQYAGYVAWRGVCDEAVLSRHTLATCFEHFGFDLPPGEQLIGYPVAGAGNVTTPGQRRYNFVWYRPAAETGLLRELLTDADGEHHALGIAPNKVSWRQIAQMREAARRLLAPQFAEIIEKCGQPFLQPIHDLVSQQLVFGRVALMGDAAFVARPHLGMGVTKAAEDAMALSDCIGLHGATTTALQAYQAQRLVAGQAVVQQARKLGAYMQAQEAQQAQQSQQAQGVPSGSQDSPGAVSRDGRMVLQQTAAYFPVHPQTCADQDPSSTRQPAPIGQA
jgi:2-polyprenyl-6-methoxyphenol hydroxylase-like FAD-dependent oxidoreductase